MQKNTDNILYHNTIKFKITNSENKKDFHLEISKLFNKHEKNKTKINQNCRVLKNMTKVTQYHIPVIRLWQVQRKF